MPKPTPEKPTDPPSSGATRRELFQIGNVLALPALLGAFEAEAAPAPGPLTVGHGMEIYRSIGVEPVINCRGTFTIIGASVELPEVRAAMDAACQYYVQLDELAEAVGRRLAELTGAEWGMVSAGCAAGLKHVTAACVAGGNPEKLIRIPDLTGFDKTEVVIPRSSRSVYDHAIRNIGVRVIMVDTAEEMQNALSSRTAMIYLSAGGADVRPLALENVAKMAQPRNIPILVDAAAEDSDHSERSPAEGRHRGGVQRRQGDTRTAMRRPAARPERPSHVRLAGQFSTPRAGTRQQGGARRDRRHAGRGGSLDEARSRGEWKTWLSWLDTIAKRVSHGRWRQDRRSRAAGLSNRSPVAVHLLGSGEAACHRRGNRGRAGHHQTEDRARRGRWRRTRGRGAPRTPADLHRDHGVDDESGRRSRPSPTGFTRCCPKSAPEIAAASRSRGNLSGRWDVDVEFFSSKSQHTLHPRRRMATGYMARTRATFPPATFSARSKAIRSNCGAS